MEIFLIAAAGCFAGFVDSMVGGGGLVSLPSLLLAGLPLDMALGTNKLQSSCGVTVSAVNYLRRGLVDRHLLLWGMGLTALGAVSGTISTIALDNSLLEPLIPWLLATLLAFTLLRGQFGLEENVARINTLAFYTVFGFGLGFYDGFFGPGTGIFWSMSLVAFQGLNLRRATAQTKSLNATSNIVAFSTFAFSGQVNYAVGFSMAGGTILGAYLGSSLMALIPLIYVKGIFVVVILAMIIRLVIG